VTPASIHEIFKVKSTLSVSNCPFLIVFWSSGANARLDSVSKTQEVEPLLSTVFAHGSQYLSTTAIPLPTSKRASFVAAWPQLLHIAGLLERLSRVLMEEKILFIRR